MPVYVSPSATFRSGFGIRIGWLSVGWLLVTLAVISACMLLFNPSEKEKPVLFRIQTAVSISILVVAALHAGPYVGVVMAGLGACVLIAGAVLRYR